MDIIIHFQDLDVDLAPEIVYEKIKALEPGKRWTGHSVSMVDEKSIREENLSNNTTRLEKESNFEDDVEAYRKSIGLTLEDDQNYPELQEIACTPIGNKKFTCTK